jgi:plasmid stabilization system protein ParE
MDFKVIFSDTFLADLEAIVRFIAAKNPRAATNLGELIVQTGESLRFLPERYPKVRQRPELRRFIVRKHFKVFYRIHNESRIVQVLRCWDARRESDPVLK